MTCARVLTFHQIQNYRNKHDTHPVSANQIFLASIEVKYISMNKTELSWEERPSELESIASVWIGN